MRILILGEHSNGRLADATARTVSAARAVGGEIDMLISGSGLDAVATEAAMLAGVSSVLVADAAGLEHQLAEDVAPLMVGLAERYDMLMAAATSSGKNIMPRVAALLDVMQVSDITAVVSGDTFERPIYAGNLVATVQVTEHKSVLTVRPSAFSAVERTGTAQIVPVTVPVAQSSTRFVSALEANSERPELGSARIVVSGGRGFGSRERFEAMIHPLADRLGAAVGASRAAVDSGYVSNEYQVGQTGKIVAPDLYIACGISGAIQHLAGMKDAKVIVAINSDADAPIFQVADYGLVADISVALPELTAKL